ncbi:MAG: hypothetical protein JNL30_01100 [Rubrivivax sp.]|nr:hypothetical protein [Rubrivivax sp.]
MNGTQPDEALVRAFMAASADLLQGACTQVMAEDADAGAGLASMLRAGGMVRLAATLSPSSGQAWLTVQVVEPNGEAHELMSRELQRLTTQ